MIYRNTRKKSRNSRKKSRHTRKKSRHTRKKSTGQKKDYRHRGPSSVWLCDKHLCVWTRMLCLFLNVLWLWYYILYSIIKLLGASSIFVLELQFQLMGYVPCKNSEIVQCYNSARFNRSWLSSGNKKIVHIADAF